jgi:hypothetical protein
VAALAAAIALVTAAALDAAVTLAAARALAEAGVALAGVGLLSASPLPLQEIRAKSRPAAQGTRVTPGSVQALSSGPRISDASLPERATY